MKKFLENIKYSLLFFVLIAVTGCLSHQERILEKHIRLHENRCHIIDTMAELGTKVGAGKKAYIDSKFSQNNLSYFLLTTPLRKIPARYDFEAESYDMGTLLKANNFLMRHGTSCRIDDIRSMTWDKKPNGDFKGSFSFETEYGFKGRCLFEGNSEDITKMVIANRGSNILSDGYGVFGCRYGRNILQEYPCDGAIILPLSNNGTVFTEKLDGDLNISLRRNGSIFFKDKVIQKDQLDDMLSLYKGKESNKGRFFLWIDKQASDNDIQNFKKKIITISFPAYQVFRSLKSDKEGRIVLIAQKLQEEKNE